MARHRHLKFKLEYLRDLIKGRKHTTIRRERKYDEGEIVYITDLKGRVYGRAFISRVEEKRIGDLSDDDARRDGFNSLRELIHALENIYGRLDSRDVIYIYHLEVLEVFRDIE